MSFKVSLWSTTFEKQLYTVETTVRFNWKSENLTEIFLLPVFSVNSHIYRYILYNYRYEKYDSVCVRAAAPVSVYMSLVVFLIKAVNTLAVQTGHMWTFKDDERRGTGLESHINVCTCSQLSKVLVHCEASARSWWCSQRNTCTKSSVSWLTKCKSTDARLIDFYEAALQGTFVTDVTPHLSLPPVCIVAFGIKILIFSLFLFPCCRRMEISLCRK